jgi:hypothetical protein
MDRAKIVNTPLITWYLGTSSASPVSLTIQSVDGRLSRTVAVPAKAGITRYAWDGRFDPPAGSKPPPPRPAGESAFLASFRPPPGVPAGPGVYRLSLTAGGTRVEGVLQVREDPLVTGGVR